MDIELVLPLEIYSRIIEAYGINPQVFVTNNSPEREDAGETFRTPVFRIEMEYPEPLHFYFRNDPFDPWIKEFTYNVQPGWDN